MEFNVVQKQNLIFLPIWGPLINVVRLITVILITERRRVL
jgi:hypothetical protein